MKNYTIFEGIELMYITGDAGTSVALDDIARALGYFFASDLKTVIGMLSLDEEKQTMRQQPRGVITMVSLAAAVKIAETFGSREGKALATFLRTELPMSEFDRIRYNNLPQESIDRLRLHQAVSRLLENHPNASPELVAERLGIDRADAGDLLKVKRMLQGLVSERSASDGGNNPRPLPPHQMNH